MLLKLLWLSPRSLPLAAGAALLLIAAVIALYPAQVRTLPHAWRWALYALRSVALITLVASFAQPALALRETEKERGSLLVLIDRSRSMSVIDKARPPAQLVALADALGLLPSGLRSAGTAGLYAALDEIHSTAAEIAHARGDLSYSEITGRGVASARAHVAEAATRLENECKTLAARASSLPADADLKQSIAALGQLPSADGSDRWLITTNSTLDAARAAAANYDATFDSRLYRSNSQVRQACDELAKLSRFELVEQALLRPKRGLFSRVGEKMPVLSFAIAEKAIPIHFTADPLHLGAKPDALWSDLTNSVASAVADAGAHKVRAIVLLSDGREVAPSGAAQTDAATDIPIFAINVAASGSRDVSFERVSAPRSAFVGETITIRAVLRATGLPTRPGDIRLKMNDLELRPSVTDHAAGMAEFSVKLERPGAQQMMIEVPPVAGEVTPENNRVQRWVKVLPHKMKVAAYAGTPGWDFQLLRNTLSRTSWVQLESAVLDPASPAVTLAPQQVLQQDIVILSDVPVAALDDARWDALYRLVAERGGSVILLAGLSHLPAEYSQRLLASNLLPFRSELKPAWREWPGEQPAYRLVPTADASRTDSLRLTDDAGSNERRWQELPSLYRFLPLSTWDAASRRFTELKPNTRALLIEAESHAAVLTESRVGAGRSFLLGSDETWRWRMNTGERDFDRFWLQLIRHAADEPYAVTQGPLSLDADKVAAQPGESLRIRARVTDDRHADVLDLQVLRDGKIVRTLKLPAVAGGGAGRFEATLAGLESGDYLLRLLEGANGIEPVQLALHVAISPELEMADISPDEALLRRLADASGGAYLKLEELERLPERLEHLDDARPKVTHRSIWDSPYLFAFVVACFTAEWALRKQLGLA